MQKNSASEQLPKRRTFHKAFTFSKIKKSSIVEIIAKLFIILFLYTGVSKLMDFHLTVEQISESPLFAQYAEFIAWSLPATEFVISLLLFFPVTRLAGLYSTLAIMSAFMIYIIIVLNYNPQTTCSCGGIISELSWTGHIIFNAFCLAITFIAIRLNKNEEVS